MVWKWELNSFVESGLLGIIWKIKESVMHTVRRLEGILRPVGPRGGGSGVCVEARIEAMFKRV
jgi:hypothetical protein